MPAPYSDDLRQQAIDAVEPGDRKTDVSRMLKISRNPLDQWLKRKDQTGEWGALRNYQQRWRHKITDGQRFREFVQAQGGMTPGQMATLGGAGGTQPNISEALPKMGVSRKKRLTGIKNAINSSAQRFRND